MGALWKKWHFTEIHEFKLKIDDWLNIGIESLNLNIRITYDLDWPFVQNCQMQNSYVAYDPVKIMFEK